MNEDRLGSERAVRFLFNDIEVSYLLISTPFYVPWPSFQIFRGGIGPNETEPCFEMISTTISTSR
jgi:hypothetical protein